MSCSCASRLVFGLLKNGIASIFDHSNRTALSSAHLRQALETSWNHLEITEKVGCLSNHVKSSTKQKLLMPGTTFTSTRRDHAYTLRTRWVRPEIPEGVQLLPRVPNLPAHLIPCGPASPSWNGVSTSPNIHQLRSSSSLEPDSPGQCWGRQLQHPCTAL
jgi:hypothetical protein